MRLLDSSGREMLRGDFEPAAMDDLWMRATLPSGRGDASATYQSVITDLVWAGGDRLPCAARAARGDAGGHALGEVQPRRGRGRGRTMAGDPHVRPYRRLRRPLPLRRAEDSWPVAGCARWTATPRSTTRPARMNEEAGTAFVDLGNSIRATSRGGPLVDVGPLRLAAQDADGVWQDLAPLAGAESGFYERTAGIVTAALTPAQLKTVAVSRLAVVTASDKSTVVLARTPTRPSGRADRWVFRLYPEKPHDRERPRSTPHGSDVPPGTGTGAGHRRAARRDRHPPLRDDRLRRMGPGELHREGPGPPSQEHRRHLGQRDTDSPTGRKSPRDSSASGCSTSTGGPSGRPGTAMSGPSSSSTPTSLPVYATTCST